MSFSAVIYPERWRRIIIRASFFFQEGSQSRVTDN